MPVVLVAVPASLDGPEVLRNELVLVDNSLLAVLEVDDDCHFGWLGHMASVRFRDSLVKCGKQEFGGTSTESEAGRSEIIRLAKFQKSFRFRAYWPRKIFADLKIPIEIPFAIRTTRTRCHL